MKIKDSSDEHPRYLARIGNDVRGPYDMNALETLALIDVITPDTLLAQENTAEFKPVTDWPFHKQLFPRKYWALTTYIPRAAIVKEPVAEERGRAAKLTLSRTDPVPVPTVRRNVNRDGLTASSEAPMKPIDSMEEFRARSEADPSDPLVVAAITYIHAEMQRTGHSRARVLRRYFRENQKLNRLQAKVRGQRERPDAPVGFARSIKNAAIAGAITLNPLCVLIMYVWPGARHNGPTAILVVNLCCGLAWVFSAEFDNWLRTHFFASFLVQIVMILLLLCFLGTIVGSVFTRDPNFDPFTWIWANAASEFIRLCEHHT
jgi:hypothetical protein